MNIFFISDTHFFHKNIIKYCERPFSSVEEMNEHIVRVWNERVGHQDVVYHLGDVIFGGREKANTILPRLKGQKILVRGNHDQIKIVESHFTLAGNLVSIKPKNDLQIILCHFPLAVWENSHKGSYHFHGHSHGSLPSKGRRLDIGVDGFCKHYNYGPVSLEEIMEVMKAAEVYFPDNHRINTN